MLFRRIQTLLDSPRYAPLTRYLPTTVAALILLWVFSRTSALLASMWHFNTDDAYITLRYARHLAAGHGVTWNLDGAPVEGYSNFLFVLLGAGAIRLGFDPIVALKYLNCAALFGTCLVQYTLARRWVGPVAATLPAILLTSYIGTYMWTVSGLETAVYQFLAISALALAITGFDRWKAACAAGGGELGTTELRRLRLLPWERWFVAAGGVVFLASITRPEGPLLFAVCAGLLAAAALPPLYRALRHRDPRSRAIAASAVRGVVVLALSFGVAYTLYFAWRYNDFGRLLPNTVACKSGFSGSKWALLEPFWTFAMPAIALAFIHPLHRFDLRRAALLATPVLYALILYGADPIIGYHNRHFLAAYAMLLVPTAVGLAHIARVVFERLPRGAGELALVLIVAVFFGSLDDTVKTPALKWIDFYAKRMQVREDVGHWLNTALEPEDFVVVGDAGMIPYIAHSNVIDGFCLNSREFTSREIERDNALFIPWLLSSRPKAIIVHSRKPKDLSPRPEYGFYPALVKAEPFKEDYTLARVFGAPGDDFHYWIYFRR